jgi:dTDP-4-amino-4,6-dideoxygalactose transaminase
VDYLNTNAFGATQVGEQETAAVLRVLQSKQLFRLREDGRISENEQFETEVCKYLGCTDAVTVSNGTAGLRAMLIAMGIQSGNYVAVSAYTFIATVNAVLSIGAIPLPIDVNDKFGMDCDDLKSKIAFVKAIIVVYLPGHSSNVPQVVAMAAERGIPVIEDACQAFGVTTGGKHAGTIGTLGVFSFQQNKQITCGEGGVVVGSDTHLTRKVRKFADHGAVRLSDGTPTWNNTEAGVGDNLRMTELQAAILRQQLTKVDGLIATQRHVRECTLEVVDKWPVTLVTSVDPAGDTGAYIGIKLERAEDADMWIRAAAEMRIILRRFWPAPFNELSAVQRAIGLALPQHLTHTPRTGILTHRLLAMPLPPTLEGPRLQMFLDALNKLPHVVARRQHNHGSQCSDEEYVGDVSSLNPSASVDTGREN